MCYHAASMKGHMLDRHIELFVIRSHGEVGYWRGINFRL